jgi:hypothetical protein
LHPVKLATGCREAADIRDGDEDTQLVERKSANHDISA